MTGEITAESIEKDYEDYMKSVITPEDKAEISEEISENPDAPDEASEEKTEETDSVEEKADETASAEEKPTDSDENKE